MKFLVDVCLSPKWIPILESAGWSTIHWSAIGPLTASDHEIMFWAKENDHIVFTHDLDFGAILAATNAQWPSVVQLREQDTDPASIGSAVIAGITQCMLHLQSGALVSIDLRRAKARILPIERDDQSQI